MQSPAASRYQTSLVRSCASIAGNAGKLRWQPTTHNLYFHKIQEAPESLQLSTARKIASKAVLRPSDYALTQKVRTAIRKARKRQRRDRKANRD